jgi:peptidoglycan/LPS O-acetylase OafA/YrhL
MMRAEESVRHRNNSFDLLRLLAAFLVFWGHQYGLMGHARWVGLPDLTWFGLFAFFAISGYLNTRSLLASQSARSFLISRGLRIYPALIVCVLLMIAMGAMVTSRDWSSYFLSMRLATFFLHNTTILAGITSHLPGVFENNPLMSTLNGSLWTLTHEAYLYIMLAGMLAWSRYSPRTILLAFGVAIALVCIAPNFPEELKILPGVRLSKFAPFAVTFFAGAVIAAYEPNSRRAASWAAHVGCWTVAAGAWLAGNGTLMICVMLASIVILVGNVRPPLWLAPKRDISYGFYIYAFPIQQLMISLHLTGFWGSSAIGLLATILLATLSQILIEAPALALKDRLVNSTARAPAAGRHISTPFHAKHAFVPDAVNGLARE